MEQAEDSSPDPSSSDCDIRIQKKGISRSFAEFFPLRKTSAVFRGQAGCGRECPRILFGFFGGGQLKKEGTFKMFLL